MENTNGIIDYVMHTPNNSNPNVMRGILEKSNSSSGGNGIAVFDITLSNTPQPNFNEIMASALVQPTAIRFSEWNDAFVFTVLVPYIAEGTYYYNYSFSDYDANWHSRRLVIDYVTKTINSITPS